MRVVITGASSGIGRALAAEFARRFPGVDLMLVARREERLAALAASLPDARCDCYALDVTDGAALHAACRDYLARRGTPDVVVANAGISAGTVTGAKGDRAVFRRIMEVNLLAVPDTFAPFIAPMRAAGQGRLVGIASVAGIRGIPGSEAYSASKAALITYLESLRVGLRGSGVSVLTISPGYVRSEMTAANPYPMPFLISAEEFARRAVQAILRGDRYRTIPWQMGLVSAALRCMPRPLYDRLFEKAPRKPRRPEADDEDMTATRSQPQAGQAGGPVHRPARGPAEEKGETVW